MDASKFRKSDILTVKVLEVHKPLFLKEYASNSGPESVHTRAEVRHSVYIHGMKEDKTRTVKKS
jgi:hypothetical protein